MRDEAWGHAGGHREHEWARGKGGEWRERAERGRGRGRGGWGGPGPFGPGPGPWGPGPWGPGPGPFGPRFGRGQRVRRGDVRAAILDLLAEEQPWNGYQLIQEIAARTDEMWRPSAGSVYPALQQLEDEGLITAEAGEDRRRMYRLTESGREYVQAHADELRASWDAVTGNVDDAAFQLRDTIKQVMVAIHQVAQAGSAAQVSQASKVLADARRALYRILASDGEDATEDTRA
ncbi:MAG TPA: PadR family transcriptional regulator [Streptosporangiaceae bacterium]|nr:PadR family transcriptional regulator [Streptosporangiaceae bacterium]